MIITGFLLSFVMAAMLIMWIQVSLLFVLFITLVCYFDRIPGKQRFIMECLINVLMAIFECTGQYTVSQKNLHP